MEVPAISNAVALGSAAAVAFFLARSQRAHLWLPAYLLAVLGLAFALRTLDYRFVLESLRFDPPWRTAGLMALWCGAAAAGWLRVRSWWAVVLGAIAVGDMAVAIGLSLCEPDTSRRARLVLAASGASIIGPWSGATAVALGWGGMEMAAFGLVLALVGLVGGGSAPAVVAPDRAAALRAAAVPLWLALFTWVFMLGGVADFAAMGIENIPVLMPQQQAAWLGGVAALLGALGAETALALFAQDVLLHATQIRGLWAADGFRIGLAVGGGLPLMMATGCRLIVGIPLWVLQVLLALGFLVWRHG